MINPFFSIITVTKNCQDTITQTLNSVKIQSFKDYEHIVIDGFSNDETFKIIQNYKSDKIIKKQIKDHSCFEGLNNAHKYINGKYVILLHSGDLLYSSETLEKIKKNIDEKVDLLIYNCVFYNKEKKIKRIWFINEKNLNLRNCFLIPHTATIMNTKVLDEIGNYNLSFKIASDTEYILRIFKNKKINYIISNEFLCFMRLGGLSTNFRFMMKKIIEDLKIYLTFFGKKKFFLIYLKKIFIKIKQFGNIRSREIHSKLLLVLLKKIN